jgi:hypothetical protein
VVFIRTGGFAAALDEVLAFLRPSVVHQREERQRLELSRDEEGDAGPGLPGDPRYGVSLSVPEGYVAPSGPRVERAEADSRGIVV